jgi:predicted kinase
MNKKMILIRGSICAGKTTTVNFLRNIIENSSLVDEDVFKRAIDNSVASKWRDDLSFKLALNMANTIMEEQGRIIISDVHSSFENRYKEYKKLAEKNNYEFYSFLLRPPLEEVLKRNNFREIPDVKYSITDKEIIKYWKELYTVNGERVFDTSKINPQEVIKSVIKDIGL